MTPLHLHTFDQTDDSFGFVDKQVIIDNRVKLLKRNSELSNTKIMIKNISS